jgi:alpha-tubulin suppressor-like RCC1 family protein
MTQRLPFLSMAHGAVATAALLGAASLSAQSWVRQWGTFYFDTASRESPIVRIAAKGRHTAVVRSDGRVYVQGPDDFATCRVPTGCHFDDVEIAPGGFCLGRLPSGTVTPWGSFPWASFPVAVPALPAGVQYKSMAAGYYHVVLLRSDRVAIAYGDNTFGQLNIPALPPAVTLIRVDANRNYTIGLMSNGGLVGWGANNSGECNVPLAPPGVTYLDFSAGYDHAMALRSDGGIEVWGNPAWNVQQIPPLPPGVTYQKCAAGWGWCVALRSDGVLVEWGVSPSTGPGRLPLPLAPPGVTCLQLEAGNAHGVALWSDGTCSGWGSNSFFECAPPTPSQPGIASSDRFTAIAVGANHVLCLRADGTVDGHGDGQAGQCAAPALPPGVTYTKVATRYAHSVALRSDGQLVAFGSNVLGQCLVPPLPVGVSYTDAAVSSSHTVAVRSDGVAVAFGQNNSGQCVIPPMPTGVRYVQADANYRQTLLLRSDGWIAHAGAVYSGLIPWANAVPPLPTGVAYVQVAAGINMHAALRSDGTAVTWDAGSGSVVPALPWGVFYVEVRCGDSIAWLRGSDGGIVLEGRTPLTTAPYFKIPSLEQGRSYVSLSAASENVAARLGATSTYVAVAHGCPGSRPVARLVPRDTPRIGSVLEVTVFDLPQDVAVMVLGWQQIGPITLGSVGMPGCNLHVSIDGTQALVGQANQAKWVLPIPDQPALVGMTFNNQALVLDSSCGNALGAVMSDAARAVIGHW